MMLYEILSLQADVIQIQASINADLMELLAQFGAIEAEELVADRIEQLTEKKKQLGIE